MNEGMKMAAVLLAVIIGSTALLTFADSKTAPIIQKNTEERAERTSNAWFPGAERVEEETGYSAYYDRDGLLGYIVQSSAYGYSSTIEVLVGLDPDKVIMSVSVIDQQETPGLGTKIAEPGFLDQFKGIRPRDAALIKDGGTIDGVTGATKSAAAVVAAVKESESRLP